MYFHQIISTIAYIRLCTHCNLNSLNVLLSRGFAKMICCCSHLNSFLIEGLKRCYFNLLGLSFQFVLCQKFLPSFTLLLLMLLNFIIQRPVNSNINKIDNKGIQVVTRCIKKINHIAILIISIVIFLYFFVPTRTKFTFAQCKGSF